MSGLPAGTILPVNQAQLETPPRSAMALDLLRLLRPHQWIKNVLLFVPLLLSHRPGDLERLPLVAMAFVVFCMAASAGYVFNDLRDAESDRLHPQKRRRPIASGAVPPPAAVVTAAALLLGALVLSLWHLPHVFTSLLLVYLLTTLLYSLWLKTRLLVDVFVLAGLYTLRLLAGGAATQIEITPWLLAFSMFLFLSLAFAKRHAELAQATGDDTSYLKSRNYRREDMGIILSVGPSCGYMAVLVMAIYISSDLARELYRYPLLLWLACPVLLYWITRVWFLARRGTLNEDPILFALRDRVSWVAGFITIALVVMAATLH